MNNDFEKIKTVFLKRPNIIFAYVFGSRVKGYENLRSDWDIAIFIDIEKQKESPWERFVIEAELSSLLKSNVQVVVLNNVDDPLFNFTVINEGVVVVDREPAKRIYYESNTLNRYHDWQFFLNRHMKYW